MKGFGPSDLTSTTQNQQTKNRGMKSIAVHSLGMANWILFWFAIIQVYIVVKDEVLQKSQDL